MQVTTPAILRLLVLGTLVCWFSSGGWFYGTATGLPSNNVQVRIAQYRLAPSKEALAVCQEIVAGKFRNARTLLRRNARGDVSEALKRIDAARTAAETVSSIGQLLGIEGSGTRAYFPAFRLMLSTDSTGVTSFDFQGRNRRPPRDEVNALLSFVYSVLVKEVIVACLAVGLDPLLGFYHQPRRGRPALALDLAEEFRPLIGDSVVIQVISNGEVQRKDFVRRDGGVNLAPSGRRKVLLAYERRMGHQIRHPLFDYRINYRRALEVQARLLAAWCLGETGHYKAFVTR